jgi:hypothetical protein
MQIRLTIRNPEQIEGQGNRLIVETGIDEVYLDGVEEHDIRILEKLYGLGWRPHDWLLPKLCKILSAEFLIAHEPVDRLLDAIRQLWYNEDYNTVQKIAKLLQKEEREKFVRGVLNCKQEKLQKYFDWWSEGDYKEILSLAKLFPDLFELPEWLQARILFDLRYAEEYKSKPLSRIGRCFAECLIMLAELERLGKLPENLKETAAQAIDRIRGTILERVCRTDLKNRGDYIRVAEAASVLAGTETQAGIAAALLKST